MPYNPQTLGEHILKKRIESGLLQREVAELLSVSEDSITYWENGRATPQIHHYPLIIQFLGYYPFNHECDSIAGKLQQLRYCKGYSYEQMGDMLEVNASTARYWELKKGMPKPSLQSFIRQLWAALPESIRNHSPTNNLNNETAKHITEPRVL